MREMLLYLRVVMTILLLQDVTDCEQRPNDRIQPPPCAWDNLMREARQFYTND
jgi:hypothetical protein